MSNFVKLSNGQIGEIESSFFDGGDYETNVIEFFTIVNPVGEFYTATEKTMTRISYDLYSDYRGLIYGV